MITYRRISTADHEYGLEMALRERVLRRPLGLTFSEADLRAEEMQEHIVAIDENRNVIGCVIVAFSGSTARLRQVAVDDARRGKGVGRELIRHAEAVATERNVTLLRLHARTTARGFFEKLGYTAASDVFLEVTVPHITMEKRIR